MPPSKRFSVAIAHRNGVDLLRRTLAALFAALGPDDEVLLVDNGSSDASLAMVAKEFPAVAILRNGCNRGFAAANNQAIHQAVGRFVLLLNNDALLAPDTLERLERTFETHPQAGVVSPLLVDAAGRPQRSEKAFPTPATECGLGKPPKAPLPAPGAPARSVDSVIGACMAVRRAAIDEAGPLDDAFFFYYEETEWCHRLQARGWQVLLDPGIQVVHEKGASTRPHSRAAKLEMFRSRLIYYRKVFPPAVAAWLTLCRCLRLVVNLVFHLALVIATLGLIAPNRRAVGEYLHQCAWLLAGRPAHWGLPGKCPP